jgi:hypothetical protein
MLENIFKKKQSAARARLSWLNAAWNFTAEQLEKFDGDHTKILHTRDLRRWK